MDKEQTRLERARLNKIRKVKRANDIARYNESYNHSTSYKILAMLCKYMPHQGKQEMGRRSETR